MAERDPICDAVVLKAWSALADRRELAPGQRIDELGKMIPHLVDEASTVRAIAEMVAQDSTPAAMRVRAARAEVELAAKRERGEEVGPQGAPIFSKGAHIDAVNKRVAIENAETALKQLRTRSTALAGELSTATAVLKAREPAVSPLERQQLQGEVDRREQFVKAADAEVRRAEDKLEKLRA